MTPSKANLSVVKKTRYIKFHMDFIMRRSPFTARIGKPLSIRIRTSPPKVIRIIF